MEEVILVNAKDQPIGQMEKMEAHRKGLLHRAFSVLIFNSSDQVLLQKRASSKYHSGGLWTNTCCSHPRPGETVLIAANRRLMEEMGMTADLTERFHFIYKTNLDNDLVEHELDHVLVGQSDDLPKLNPEEAEDFKYIDLETLKEELKSSPENYTVWFKIIMEAYFDHYFKVEVA
jgi:isopentenyl-diphosphate delta-isomerase